MSVLLILVPSAFALAGSAGGVAVAGSAAAGVAMIGGTVAGMVVALKIKHSTPETLAYETHLVRPDLLAAALENLGCETSTVSGQITAWSGPDMFQFQPVPGGPFLVVVDKHVKEDRLAAFLTDVYSEYSRSVQAELYQRFVEQAREQGMQLESEQVHDDNSITLTFRVDA